ncbi:outer membrane protein assembly factor BamA [Novosphingobium sp.]|uniref:outer membrane protein assembly factor BamA n=1 Tax=Novosphingobium sp. TaxID=1874826 RepID=UPI0025DEDBF8|nr:outer membrane protein assembly factor BamA [Novosphingobium sp.]
MERNETARRATAIAAVLLGTTFLAGLPTAALAQAAATAAAPAPAAPEVPAVVAIRAINVAGSQRLEPDTIMSYIKMRVGQPYTQQAADQALKDLYATELFTDVQIINSDGVVTIQVKENPVINRIVLEGNKRIKEDKILPEIKMAPRQIFTRSKVRADVSRIIELYKRQGRFAASVEPKMVMLDQNRVDIVFEITEGPKSKVRAINIIGNEQFSDGELRGEMITKQAGITKIFSSGTSYDPDKMAFDQQKLRQFYLTKGYADFRIVSAVAELTPDKRDFILTYVVEEGPRYKFGDVKVQSQLRDFDDTRLAATLPMKKGDWYDAKKVEDTIEQLNTTLGAFGYAFADVRPDYARSKEDLTMGLTFNIAEAPRVYVEKIDVNGNTLTQDKVVRREFRLAEGDAFNSLQVKRSTARINSLGYFQEKFEVEQKPGASPDRIILEANVEEKPTGELQLSAGYSSLEKLIFQGSIQQRNFRGRGQTVGLSLSYSQYSKSAEVSFTEPYLFDKNVSLGASVYRRDYNNFNYINTNRNTLYQNKTTGLSVRAGLALTEYISAVGSYTFNYDDISVDRNQYYSDRQNPPSFECDPIIAGRYLCDAIGKRTTSMLGLSLIYDTLDSRVHPTRGNSVSVTTEFAGLGGSVKYARLRLNAAKYFPVGKGFIFSVRGEAGAMKSLGRKNDTVNGIDGVFLTDRFYLGEPTIRGFDIRGVGPRVVRKFYQDTNADGTVDGLNYVCFRPAVTTTPTAPADRQIVGAGAACSTGYNYLTPDTVNEDRTTWQDDAIGGRYYYLTRAELEIPLGSGAKSLGLRPSLFMDAGAVWGITRPRLESVLVNGLFFPTRDASGVPQYSQICNGTPTVIASPTTPTLPATCIGTGDGVNALGSTYPAFQDFFYGNTIKPRISIGIGVNWNSPFGPFRIDFAKVLTKAEGDDTKTFTFNVGTQF